MVKPSNWTGPATTGGQRQWYSFAEAFGPGGLPQIQPEEFGEGAWPEPAGAEQQQKEPAPKDVRSPIDRGAQLIGSALQAVAGLIGAKGQQLVSAIANIASQLMPQFGPIFGGIASVVNAIFGQKQAVKVEPADGSMPIHFSTRADYGWDVNPASALLGGRAIYTSPASPTVELVVNYQEGVEDVIAMKTAQSVNMRQMRPARRLSYGH